MITYTDYSAVKRGSVGGLKSYHFTTVANHICTIYKNKWLKFYNGILSLSLDNGATYPITLDISSSGSVTINYSKIFADGTIMWADYDHCYYSEDNLATYHTSTVLARNGSAYVPDTVNHDNFQSLSYHQDVILPNGKQLVCFHNYKGEDSAKSNVWYTIDNGKTIKSAFSKGVDCGAIDYRHIDMLNYNPEDNSWWINTGDSLEINWIHGHYDWENDLWNDWTIINSGHDYWHASGMSFHAPYVYWGSDTTAEWLGVWRLPIANISDPPENWVKKEVRVTNCANFWSPGFGLIISSEIYYHKLHLSFDHGETWEVNTLTGGPTFGGFSWYFAPQGPDNNNWYKIELCEDDVEDDWKDMSGGIVLMMQIIPTAGSN